MDLKRCSNGHFYDAEAYAVCPHCNSGLSSEDLMPETAGAIAVTEKYTDTGLDSSSTSAIKNDNSLGSFVHKWTDDPISNNSNDDGDDSATIGILEEKIGFNPTVGWLVCVEGKNYGDDFRLKGSKNFIGRSDKMDVCLKRDQSVSRDKHAVIIFEPESNLFLIQSGESKELTYHNDKLVLSAVELKAYDIIKVGATKLMFVPLCSDKFMWDAEKGKDSDK